MDLTSILSFSVRSTKIVGYPSLIPFIAPSDGPINANGHYCWGMKLMDRFIDTRAVGDDNDFDSHTMSPFIDCLAQCVSLKVNVLDHPFPRDPTIKTKEVAQTSSSLAVVPPRTLEELGLSDDDDYLIENPFPVRVSTAPLPISNFDEDEDPAFLQAVAESLAV